ncbi:hypothetical protein WJX74_000743 [Apatococcus lobatus]|uniref:Uncharacterized protein n=1 Tax=Apatococcus lobatus TaxID=904363 RepID=A0AAW1Q630_9CHLO
MSSKLPEHSDTETFQAILLPRHDACLEYISAYSRSKSEICTLSPQPPSSIRSGAQVRLFHPTSARARPLRKGLMRTYLEAVALEAADRGRFNIVEWIIASEPCSMLRVALHAAEKDCSDTFAILDAHQCLMGLPMDDRLVTAAGKGSLQTAKHLTLYLRGYSASNDAMFKALVAAMHRIRHGQVTMRQDLEVIRWLWEQFTTFCITNGPCWTQ